MTTLGPGWAEKLGTQVASAKDETERSAATGLRPRRVWRGNEDVTQESRMRGAYASGRSKRRNRALPPLFAEDVKEGR